MATAAGAALAVSGTSPAPSARSMTGNGAGARAYLVENLFVDCERRSAKYLRLPAHTFERVFRAICSQIVENLASLKGTNIAGLGKFSFRVEKRDMGTAGVRESYIPIFIPAEIFLRMHDIRITQKPVNRSLAPSPEVNIIVMTQELELRKEIVTSAIKQLIDTMGIAIGGGSQIDLAFGFGRLLSDRKIMHFHFLRKHSAFETAKSAHADVDVTVSSSRLGTPHRPGSSGSEMQGGGPATAAGAVTAANAALLASSIGYNNNQAQIQAGEAELVAAAGSRPGTSGGGVDILVIDHSDRPEGRAKELPSIPNRQHTASDFASSKPSARLATPGGVGVVNPLPFGESKASPALRQRQLTPPPIPPRSPNSIYLAMAHSLRIDPNDVDPRFLKAMPVPKAPVVLLEDPDAERLHDPGHLCHPKTKREQIDGVSDLPDDDPRRQFKLTMDDARRQNQRYAKHKGTNDHIFAVQHAAEAIRRQKEAELESPAAAGQHHFFRLPSSDSESPSFRSLAASPGVQAVAMDEAMKRFHKEQEHRRVMEDAQHLEFEAQVANAKRLEEIQREQRKIEQVELRKMLSKQMEELQKKRELEKSYVNSAHSGLQFNDVTREQDLAQKATYRSELNSQIAKIRIQREKERQEEVTYTQRIVAENIIAAEREKEQERQRKLDTTRLLTDAWSKQKDDATREAFIQRHSSPSKFANTIAQNSP